MYRNQFNRLSHLFAIIIQVTLFIPVSPSPSTRCHASPPETLERWAQKNCARVGDPDCEEYEHGSFELYDEYVKLFEEMMTDRLNDSALSAEELYRHLKSDSDGKRQADTITEEEQILQGKRDFLSLMLLQMVDFGAFMQMMKEERRQQLGRRNYTFTVAEDGIGGSSKNNEKPPKEQRK